jgi:hypothetical protein
MAGGALGSVALIHDVGAEPLTAALTRITWWQFTLICVVHGLSVIAAASLLTAIPSDGTVASGLGPPADAPGRCRLGPAACPLGTHDWGGSQMEAGRRRDERL